MVNEQDATASASTGWQIISPADIQRQEFGVSRFGGYRMRDVDEFLDRLTESTRAIVAENERLRAGVGPILGSPDLDEVNRQAEEIVQRAREEAARITSEAGQGSGGAMMSPTDRGAVDAFLTQERDFLQSLAALVQGHAETVKGMARKARQAPEAPIEPPEAAADAMPVASASEASAPMPSTVEEPVRVDEPQPAIAGGGDRDAEGDPSLKQLFWGEEN